MSITFPTFTDKEIVTPEKLNTFVQALEAKFTAGLGTTELQWPLLAGGDLIMGSYSIDGVLSFWSMQNGARYDTFADALTAASNGCIFLPPSGTAIEVSDEALLGASVTIMGGGPRSILRIASGASVYGLRNTTAGAKLRFFNLLFDGNDVSGINGLEILNGVDCIISNCWFTDFGGEAIKITGSGGTASENIIIENCHFSGGAGKHIYADDVDGLTVTGCVFDTCGEQAIYLAAEDSGAFIRSIAINGNAFRAGVDSPVYIVGSTANAVIGHSGISVSGNVMDCSSQSAGDGITLGTTSLKMMDFSITGNTLQSCFADAIAASGVRGVISGNMIKDAGSNGIDIQGCSEVMVQGNHVQDATEYGIETSTATNCFVGNNDTRNAGTGEVNGFGDDMRIYHNGTFPSPPPLTGIYTTAESYIVPASTLKPGDVIEIEAGGNTSGAGNAELTFDGNRVAYIGTITVSGGDVVLSAVGVVTSDTQIEFVGRANYAISGAAASVACDHYSLTGLTLSSANTVLYTDAFTQTNFGLRVNYKSVEIQ